MKTIQDFIKEIEGSAELQAALKAIKDKDSLAAFLKKYDVDGTVEDFGKALKSKAEAEGEITDDAAEAVAGETAEHALGGTAGLPADGVSDPAAAGTPQTASGKAPEPSRSYDEWLDFVRDTTGADQRRDQGDSDGAE